MPPCPHLNFDAHVEVHRFANDVAPTFMAEITIKCVDCGEPFQFLGPGAGLSFSKPCVNVPGTTLHAPIAPGERLDVPTRLKFEVA